MHRSITDFIELVQLSLKLNEVLSSVTVDVNHTFLELLQCVNYLEEIALIQEEIIITDLAFFGNHLRRND